MTRYRQRFLVLLFCLALNSFAAYGQTRPKVVIGYASMSSVATKLWVTQEKGFFEPDGAVTERAAI